MTQQQPTWQPQQVPQQAPGLTPRAYIPPAAQEPVPAYAPTGQPAGPYAIGQHPAEQTGVRGAGSVPFSTPGAQPASTPTTTRPRRRVAGRLASLAAAFALATGGGAGGAAYVLHTQVPTATAVTQVVQGPTTAVDWARTAAAVLPSSVSVTVSGRSGKGEGSGVIWDAQGHVVTNNHVATALGASATITVTLQDGTTLPATVVATDPANDLAMLQITDPPRGLVPIQVADSTTVRVGDQVMAVGNPLGLSETVTTGVVSALDRPVVESTQQGSTTITAIQTSAAINPGSSGGALVDADGQLVGINFSIAALSSASGNIGIGFAIPANRVRSVVDGMLASR